jgi:hypothetical protein
LKAYCCKTASSNSFIFSTRSTQQFERLDGSFIQFHQKYDVYSLLNLYHVRQGKLEIFYMEYKWRITVKHNTLMSVTNATYLRSTNHHQALPYKNFKT